MDPVLVLLWCPMCGERHVDGEAGFGKPHHTHACGKCGMHWRPAVVATVGVSMIGETMLTATEPVPMLLWCPMCRTRHVDVGKYAIEAHHGHACQNPECGFVWRPSATPTAGVRTLPGFLNESAETFAKLSSGVVSRNPEVARLMREELSADPKVADEIRRGAAAMPADLKLSMLANAIAECNGDGGCRAMKIVNLLELEHG